MKQKENEPTCLRDGTIHSVSRMLEPDDAPPSSDPKVHTTSTTKKICQMLLQLVRI